MFCGSISSPEVLADFAIDERIELRVHLLDQVLVLAPIGRRGRPLERIGLEVEQFKVIVRVERFKSSGGDARAVSSSA